MSEPLILPADEFAAVKTVRERLETALDASIDRCPRCKVCDTQIGAAMTVLGPLLERAEAAEGKLAEIAEFCHEQDECPRCGCGESLVKAAARILAIIGTEEKGDAGYDRDFDGPVL